MIISFSGHNGSGKTAVSKALASQLGFDWWGMADITRSYAKQLGISISELDERMRHDPSLDKEIDKRLAALSAQSHLVVDARCGWHFIPSSIKVFITASEDVRVARCFNNSRPSESYESIEDARVGLRSRIAAVSERLNALYGIDVYDESNFDIVIDSTQLSVDECVQKILDQL